jgi:nucleotide-binding universal stress UspA family protein
MYGACRIVAGISGSPGSVHALRQAAGLARYHDAPLVPVHAWLPPDSRSLPWPELRQLWEDDAWQRLWDTLDRAFGGLAAGVTTQPVVLRGKPGKALTGLARQPGDLLVIGAGRPRLLRQRLVRQHPFGVDLRRSMVMLPVRQGAAACRSCVCDDNKTEGGCCCQDRGRCCGPETL